MRALRLTRALLQAKKGFFEKAAQGDPNAAADIKSQRKQELEGVSGAAGVRRYVPSHISMDVNS
jgi:hypothetical protein